MCDEMVFIHAGWLIDGSGAAVQRQKRVGLQNGVIRSICKMTEPLPDYAKSGESVLDLCDCTLLPGLIDCHVHLAMSATAKQHPAADKSAQGQNRILTHLNTYITRGIMAVRDGGDPASSVLHFKADQMIKEHPIHLSAAGTAWHRPGRYGDLIGRALSSDQTLAETILQEPAAIDHIKIVNSGLNSLTAFGKQTDPQFDTDELKAAVRAARHRGFKTMVHANGKIPVKTALDAGCDSIEHGFFMGAENMHQMADSRTTWVPTAVTMQALKHRMKRRGQTVDVVQKNLDHQIEQIQIARKLGVRVALGTDAGSAGVQHGQAVIKEMRIYLDAGYPIEEVVACAARNGALLLGLQQLGQVKEKMQANLIAVRGDPSQLPESLERPEVLFYKGNHINLDNQVIN